MLINDESVLSFFRTNFEIAHKHNISLTEIENMAPYERDFYIGLVNHSVQKQNEMIERQKLIASRNR